MIMSIILTAPLPSDHRDYTTSTRGWLGVKKNTILSLSFQTIEYKLPNNNDYGDFYHY